jgi:hypothetical protein
LHSASEQTRGNSFAEIGKPWTHALVRRLLCRLEEKSSIPSWQAVQSIGAPPYSSAATEDEYPRKFRFQSISDRTRPLQDTAATGCCCCGISSARSGPVGAGHSRTGRLLWHAAAGRSE